MTSSAVLVLQPSKFEFYRFFRFLQLCARHVQDVLYVDFFYEEPGLDAAYQTKFSCTKMFEIIEKVYKSETKEMSRLDIRVCIDGRTSDDVRYFSRAVNVAFLDSSYKNVPNFVKTAYKRYNWESSTQIKFLDELKDPGVSIFGKLNALNVERERAEEIKSYSSVAVGGTFDRIHNGHRLLLSTSCLLSNSRIVVGVSSEALLVNKVLGELIEPLETRMKNVAEFIDDVKPGLIKEIVPLNDPAGPTKTDPKIDCLIVSQETLSGALAVNELRRKSGLPEMNIFAIDLVDDPANDSNNERKMSSTARRQQDLGVLLQPVLRKSNIRHSNVYVIGLTGGIASGKSSIARRLEKLGAEIIDADTVGHSVYEPKTPAFNEIVKTFGDGILNDDNTIDRKSLGNIVFNDSEKLKMLNVIVWPKILTKIEAMISDLAKKGCQVCVIEAAVLLEASWEEAVDEVWVSIIPPAEAVKRMKERNGFTEEEAEKRLGNQMTNKERATRANVVLSTFWEPEYTQKLVEKAWKGLMERVASR